MSNDVSKLDLHGWLLPPAGAAASKLGAHAWLAPKDMAAAKLGLHAWLMPMTVGVAKLSAHAWLVPDLPDFPPYEGGLAFESVGGLGIGAPTLVFLGALAFEGGGRVAFDGRADPPFHCAPGLATVWSGAGAAVSDFDCASVAPTPWRAADASDHDILADVAGEALVYRNGDRIRLA